MPQKTYEQLREDIQKIMKAVEKEMITKGKVEFLIGKVIALCPILSSSWKSQRNTLLVRLLSKE